MVAILRLNIATVDSPIVPPPFDAAELTAMAHLYRGELYHATVWRTRLDATTNWAVVMTGVILSAAAASERLPVWSLLVLAGALMMFLLLEARRYRYHDIWRVRARVIEHCLFAPLLRHSPLPADWREILAADYVQPRFHLSAWDAIGCRLRRIYLGLFALQGLGYFGKLMADHAPGGPPMQWVERAAIGQMPGVAVLSLLAVFYGSLLAIAFLTARSTRTVDRIDRQVPADRDPLLALVGVFDRKPEPEGRSPAVKPPVVPSVPLR